jgi:hypothetical protein
MSDAQAQAQRILDRLKCQDRGSCACHVAARRGRGLTHAVWRGDREPSLNVGVSADRVLVFDHCGRSQAETIAELRARGLWPELSVRVARIPYPFKDVDELLQSSGGDARYERMVAEAKPAVEWMIDCAPLPGSPRFGRLGRALAKLGPIEQEAHVRLLAQRLSMPEAPLRAALADYLDARGRDLGNWRRGV